MAETRKVQFVETRQIRRNHKTVQWLRHGVYPYDKEMDPMIAIGHAKFVEEEPAPETPSAPTPPASDTKDDKPDAPAKTERQTPDPLKTPAKSGK